MALLRISGIFPSEHVARQAFEPTASWYGEPIRSGACARTIDAGNSAELLRFERSLRACGARQVARPT